MKADGNINFVINTQLIKMKENIFFKTTCQCFIENGRKMVKTAGRGVKVH